jgi:hypothetical protein
MLINITCKYSLVDLDIDPRKSKENILELIVNYFLTDDSKNRNIEDEIKEIYDDLYEYDGEDGEFAKNFPTVDDLIADVISEIDSSKHTTNE